MAESMRKKLKHSQISNNHRYHEAAVHSVLDTITIRLKDIVTACDEGLFEKAHLLAELLYDDVKGGQDERN